MASGASLRSVALALILCGAAAAADVLVLKDGTRLEGEVREAAGVVTLRTKSDQRQFPREDVAAVIRPSTPLHERFAVDPRAEDLVLLASRSGMALGPEQARSLVEKVRSQSDPRRAASELLDALRLTPRHTNEAVRAAIDEFRREFGADGAVVEGKHYVVLTNLGGFLARKIAVRMDSMFEEYEKRLIFDEKIADRFLVKVYRSAEEYQAHGGPPGTVAYFSSQGRELVAHAQAAEDAMFASLFHEGMHQFLHFYLPAPPIWFDEGLAEYFETARLRASGGGDAGCAYDVGMKDRAAVSHLRSAVKNGATIPLARLLEMSREEFYGESRSMNYMCAWAFTHFLLESGDRTLKQLWLDYFFAIRGGASQKEANEKVFGKLDMATLERLFKSYLSKL